MTAPKSNWKGLAAALNEGDSDTVNEPVAPHTAPAAQTSAALAATIEPERPARSASTTRTPRPPRNATTPPAPAPTVTRRRALPGQSRFVDTHRMVGIYFPHELDETMRLAAASLGMTNSAFVVAAVEAFIKPDDE